MEPKPLPQTVDHACQAGLFLAAQSFAAETMQKSGPFKGPHANTVSSGAPDYDFGNVPLGLFAA
jgi:hypothetical protein